MGIVLNESKTEFTHIYVSEAAEVVIKVQSLEHDVTANHKDLCSAASKTSCTIVCLVTCHYTLSS